MNRSTDKRSQGGDLPSFLESGDAEEPRVDADAQLADDQDEGDDYDGEVEDEDAADGHDDDEALPFEDDDHADDSGHDEHEDAPRAASTRRRAAASTERRPPAGGAFAMVIGLLLTVAAFVVTLVPSLASNVGIAIEPQIVLLMGIAVFAIGANQRRVGRMQQRLDELEGERQGRDDELRDTLAELLHNQQNGQPALGEGNELQHVLLSLQRQDEKINNLTRAIKMYGKPLMEIANQSAELSGQVGQLKTVVDSNREAQRQAFGELARAVGDASNGNDFGELGELPAKIGRLEVTLAAITQRLEDTEVRKSLVRLEDANKQLQDDLKTLQRGDSVRAATEGLQQNLTKATRDLSAGIEQMRDGNLGALEGTVRDIQREVAGLATGIAQIQAAVRTGARSTTASAPAPAPTAGATTAGAADAPRAPAQAATPTNGGDAPDASGDYATGKRKSTGKNVLGAIAKLKQMKG